MSFANSVILYNCKINHNGLFNCNFGGSGATRDTTMGSTNNLATVKFTYSNCTYMRKDKTITVDENADVLDAAGVNYCRYINPDFNNTMYFYAFVEKIEYVAPSTSRLYIRTDVFMTYFDKIEWGTQYVERSNKIVPFATHEFQGRAPGGAFATDYLSNSAYTSPICYYSFSIPAGFTFYPYDPLDNDEYPHNGWVIIRMNKRVFDDPNQDSITPVISGLPSGCYWLAVNPKKLEWFLEIISGPQDDADFTIEDVAEIYYVPRDCISIGNAYMVEKEGAGGGCEYYSFLSAWDGSHERRRWDNVKKMFNGYIPKNEVLLRYPYNFVKITDRAGHEWVFKPEMFQQQEAGHFDIFYSKYFTIGDGVSLGVRIENYMDAGSKDGLCVFQNFPQIGTVSDSYQQYLALNKNSLQNQYRWLGYDAALGVTSAGIKTAGGFMSGKPTSAISGAKGTFDALINYDRQTDAIDAKLADMKSLPGSVVCSGGGNLSLMMQSAGLFIEYWSIDAVAAQKIDETYDAIGYPVNELSSSNLIEIKEKYTYFKTRNCHITGVIPEDDRAEIDKIFDSGVTIWHEASSYGVYDISANNPVS